MASAVVATHDDYQPRFISQRSSSNRTQQKFRKGSESTIDLDVVRDRNLAAMKVGGSTFEAASDDSTSLNRKSMSLNAESRKEAWRHQSDLRRKFGADTQPGAAIFAADGTVSISEMTKAERRELRRKLRRELEQVRILSSKLEAREQQIRSQSHSAGVNPSCSDAQFSGNDVRSCVGREVTSHLALTPVGKTVPFLRDIGMARQHSFSGFAGTPTGGDVSLKEKRTPKANQLYHNSEYVVGKDKMPPPDKPKGKPSSGSKRGALTKGDNRDRKRPLVEQVQSRHVYELLRQCGNLLKKLMTHKHGWVFNEPVDAVKFGLTDYHMVIKRPMDLGTVRDKLNRKEYRTPVDFAEDVRLTFSNAMTYNPSTNDVHVMADVLRKLFEEKWRVIEEKYEEEKTKTEEDMGVLDHQRPRQLPTPVHTIPQRFPVEEISDQSQVMPKKKAPVIKKPTPAKPKPKAKPKLKRDMTFQEKKKLSGNLQLLPADKVEHIVQLMKERNPNLCQKDDEIEVDIDTFDNDTLWELHRFVTNYMKGLGKNKKATQSQTVARNQSTADGAVENAYKSRKGEPGDEDVDIDDDMPNASFPPVVIDKDGGYASRSSSSGSSSSDSGSSSDSDSGSSSGSESDADDAQSADRRR